LAFVLACGTLVLAHPVWLPVLYRAIEVNDPVQRADAILVQGWGASDRIVEHVAELYQAGFGQVVFTTGAKFERLVSLLGAETWADVTKKQLVLLGVPEGRIIPVYQDLEGTWGEALAARETFKRHGIRSVIIISAPVHLWRSCRTYAKVTRSNGTRVYCTSERSNWLGPDTWWKTHLGIKALAQEYFSIFYYFFKGYL